MEKSIFDFVIAAVGDKEIELRVAGGWVRDKLCNKENNDIDIAL